MVMFAVLPLPSSLALSAVTLTGAAVLGRIAFPTLSRMKVSQRGFVALAAILGTAHAIWGLAPTWDLRAQAAQLCSVVMIPLILTTLGLIPKAVLELLLRRGDQSC